MPVTRSEARRQLEQKENKSDDDDVSSATTVSLPPALASVAAVIPPTESPKRRRPSATGKDDSSLVVSKRIKRNKNTVPRYNLRSTTATRPRSQTSSTAVTVTPRMLARQINFENWRDRVHVDAPKVPKGVVDIYCSNSNNGSSFVTACHCPLSSSHRLLVAQHFGMYGREFTHDMRQAERRQYADAFGERAVVSYPYQDAHFDDREYETLDDDTDLPSTHLRYRPRPMDVLDMRIHLLDTSDELLPRQPFISARMRSVLVNWMVELGTEYSVSCTAFHLSVTLLDAILAKGPSHRQYLANLDLVERRKRLQFDNEEDEDEDEEAAENLRSWGIIHRHEFQALGWYVY